MHHPRIDGPVDDSQIAFDERGLVPCIVQDWHSGEVLTLAYMNAESLALTRQTGEIHFFSRSRLQLWHKGATSGNVQRVKSIRYDCDGDALLAIVEPVGPACHTGERTCFHRGELEPAAPYEALPTLERTIAQRAQARPEGSYTTTLLADPALAGAKVQEEAEEVVRAVREESDDRVAEEAADVVCTGWTRSSARGAWGSSWPPCTSGSTRGGHQVLLPEAMRNKVAVERFLREAKVAAKVRSEHVARVHDVGTLEEGGIPYIVMEHLEGFDLGKLIEREGALPIEEACEIALQASEALAEVHAAGIVHRDLKPSNLFVTRKVDGSPSVKLLDFGISKLTTLGGDEPGIDPALTQTATIMGSPSYMSPEQLKSTKEVDHRADVWSLGAVLYEALTGKPAFRGESLPQVCAMIASEDPALPSTRRDGIPIELERTVLRCLDKDPDGRATLVDLARTLARYAPDRAKASLERIEAAAGPPPSPAPGHLRTPRGQRRRASIGTRMRLGEAAARGDRGGRTMSSWGHDRRRKRSGSGAISCFSSRRASRPSRCPRAASA